MSAVGFDPVAHHRERARRADARAEMFERELGKAVRLLGRAATIAAGNDCDPLVLLSMIEELDRIVENPEPTIDELVQLLRDPRTSS